MRSSVVALAVSLLLMPCHSAVAEIVQNVSLGISVEKPEAWSHVSLKAYRENLSKIESQNKEFTEAARRMATPPAIAFTKFPEPHPELNPSFRIVIRPLGAAGSMSLHELAGFVINSMRAQFTDVTIEQAPVDVTVGGLPGAYFRMAYTLRAGGQEHPALSETWLVKRGSQLIIIGAGLRRDELNGTRAEIKSIVDTLKLEPDE